MTLEADDGVKIRGWFMFGENYNGLVGESNWPKGERPTFVFMHENAGNIGMRIPYYEKIIKNLGVNILSMAYRGYSYSDDVKPTEDGLRKDGETILKFISDPDNSDYPHLAEHINRKLIFG